MVNEYIIDVRPILNKIKEGKTINFTILDEIIENYKKIAMKLVRMILILLLMIIIVRKLKVVILLTIINNLKEKKKWKK